MGDLEDPDLESQKMLAVSELLNRLAQLEAAAWPPDIWERYEFETALLQAEVGNYRLAYRLLQIVDNPPRPFVEEGHVTFRRDPTTAERYRQRIDAVRSRRSG